MKKETTKKILIGVAVTAVLSIGFQSGQNKQARIETPKPIVVQEQTKELNKEALKENVEELRGQHLSIFLAQNGMGEEFVNMQRYANLRSSLYQQGCRLIEKMRTSGETTDLAKLQQLLKESEADAEMIKNFSEEILEQEQEAKKEGEEKLTKYAKDNGVELADLIEALKKANDLDTKELQGRVVAMEKEANELLNKASNVKQSANGARFKEIEEENRRKAQRIEELHRKEAEREAEMQRNNQTIDQYIDSLTEEEYNQMWEENGELIELEGALTPEEAIDKHYSDAY